MHFHIITLFPEFFTSPLSVGILGNAHSEGKISTSYYHLVDFKEAENKRVDDVPYGGGAGMVLRPEPVARAIEYIQNEYKKRHSRSDSPEAKSYLESAPFKSGNIPVIHFTPRGENFTQEKAEEVSTTQNEFILLCGRYEGIDQRVIDELVDMEFHIGEVIVSGGEFPALYFIDALTRLIPGVLGNDESTAEESFSKALERKKEYPHYTRPEDWRGKKVPDVLLSGHHANIDQWRKDRTQ